MPIEQILSGAANVLKPVRIWFPAQEVLPFCEITDRTEVSELGRHPVLGLFQKSAWANLPGMRGETVWDRVIARDSHGGYLRTNPLTVSDKWGIGTKP